MSGDAGKQADEKRQSLAPETEPASASKDGEQDPSSTADGPSEASTRDGFVSSFVK